MLRHELWAYFHSAHCHVNICRIPVKHQDITGVKIHALTTSVGERNIRRPHLNQYEFCFWLHRTHGMKFRTPLQLGDLIWIYTGEIEKKGSWGGWANLTTPGSWRRWSCTTCMVSSFLTCSAMALLLIWLLSDPTWPVKDEGNYAFPCQVSFLLI